MYRYKYDKSYHHKSRKASRSVVLAVIVTTFIIGVAGYIGYDVIRQLFAKQAPISHSNYSSVQGDSVNQFSSQYFQFQTDDTWKEASTEEKDGHYVYRSYKGTLVVRDITVDVNRVKPETLALVRTTHVYPVTVDQTGRLIAQGGSGDHCNALMPKNAPALPTQVVQHQVSFICTPDAVLYQVVVGVVGGTTNIQMSRPTGGTATYTITYRDLTVSPSDVALRGIVESFQTR